MSNDKRQVFFFSLTLTTNTNTITMKQFALPQKVTNRGKAPVKEARGSKPGSISASVDHILHLHQTIGNQAVQRIIKSGALQLYDGSMQKDDKYPREVAELAQRVLMSNVETQPRTKNENPRVIQRAYLNNIETEKIEDVDCACALIEVDFEWEELIETYKEKQEVINVLIEWRKKKFEKIIDHLKDHYKNLEYKLIDGNFKTIMPVKIQLNTQDGDDCEATVDFNKIANTFFGGKPSVISLGIQAYPAQTSIDVELESEAALPQQYDLFCDRVFERTDIIEEISPEQMDQALYDLYLDATATGTAEINPETQDIVIESYNFWYELLKVSDKFFLQNQGVLLQKVLEIIKKRDEAIEEGKLSEKQVEEFNKWINENIPVMGRDFVYIYLNQDMKIKYRVYANIKMVDAPKAAHQLMGEEGIHSFKFSGPLEFGTRADALVIYCGTRETAVRIANLLGSSEVGIIEGRTAMTEQIGGKSGIGIGAEPKWVATGLKTGEGAEVPEEAMKQSFGTIRCEIIASAILHYRENKGKVSALRIEPKELFKRFVGIGLKGWKEVLEPPG